MNKLDSEHIGRLARNIYFAVSEVSHNELTKLGYPELDSSYSIVFQYIGKGARATEIATKGKTTKQNVKYLLENLEEKGFVQRRQDPTDGRAWIFELTPKGIAYRKKGLEIIANLERKWAKTLGEYEYVQLKQYLAKLNKVITEEKN